MEEQQDDFTTVAKVAEFVSDLMKKTKEDWVANKGEEGENDLLTHIHVFRGGELVAVLMMQPDRDNMLEAAHVAAYGFSADIIACTFEAVHSELMENPLTNSPWESGDMQYVAAAEDGVRKGWVTETLSNIVYDRHKNETFESRSFLIEGDKVHWIEEKYHAYNNNDDCDERRHAGYVSEAMHQIMAGPTMEETVQQNAAKEPLVAAMIEKMDNDDPQRRQFHQDMATLRMVVERHLVMAIALQAREGTLRSELIKERMTKPDDLLKVPHKIWNPEKQAFVGEENDN